MSFSSPLPLTGKFASREDDFLPRLRQGLDLACHWLADTAMVATPQPEEDCEAAGIKYRDWRGSLKGEYSARTGRWGFFCPYWHSSQAMKGLLMAADHLSKREHWREAALMIGEFLIRNRINDPADPDFGLPLAFEDSPHTVNTSAILEALDGLLLAGERLGAPQYSAAAIDALEWIRRRAYVPGKGVFRNSYDPLRREFVLLQPYLRVSEDFRPRPLLDDAVFLKGFACSGDESFRTVFYETADRLLQTESPQGNWIRFVPCSEKVGLIHPRHAYWWGGPMIDAWLDSGDTRYRDCALRTMDWYASAMRGDGGFFRNTYPTFQTDSFGHATSGSACAAILFLRAASAWGEKAYLDLARRALEFCLKVQFTNPSDPNLKGAILEKIIPPDGTDASPYHLRDLGTIFFVQAASLYLSLFDSPVQPPPLYRVSGHQR